MIKFSINHFSYLLIVLGILAFPLGLEYRQSKGNGPVRLGLLSEPVDMMPISSVMIRIPLQHTANEVFPPEWHQQPSFYASREEINNRVFRQFLNETGQNEGHFPGLFQRRNGKWVVKPSAWNHPVTGVTHYEAQAFCRWLSEKTGWSLHLPDSFHWRAMAQSARPGMKYPWGWTRPDSRSAAYNLKHAVPTLRKTPSTPLNQLSGNVYEWGEAVNRSNAVIRGGAWSDRDPDMLDTNLEFEQPRTLRSRDIGFRIAGTPPRR